MTGTRWHGIRVARRTRDHRDLINHAVGPMLEDIAPLVERSYYLPHWRRGPHIRILVDCSAATFEQSVLPAADKIIGSYLSMHPNQDRMDPEQFHDQHRRLAEMEQEPGPLTPWYVDDTVAAEHFPSRAAALGSDDAAELLADFYTDTTELALTMTAIDDRRLLFATAFDILIRTAQLGAPSGLARGFVAFRSHAEAYLTMAADGPGLRAAWERQYVEAADQLADRARRVLDEAAAGPRRTPTATWAAVLAGLAGRIDELATNGAIRLATTDNTGALAAVAEVSPFHRLLQDQAWWRSGFADAAWFKAYRVMLNFGYLHLTRAGITPVQRFLLCYLVSRTAEDLYATSASELIRDRQHVAGPAR